MLESILKNSNLNKMQRKTKLNVQEYRILYDKYCSEMNDILSSKGK